MSNKYTYQNPNSKHNLPQISSYAYEFDNDIVKKAADIAYYSTTHRGLALEASIDKYDDLSWLWYFKSDVDYLITLIADIDFKLVKKIIKKSNEIDINAAEKSDSRISSDVTQINNSFFYKYIPNYKRNKSAIEHLNGWYDLGADYSKHFFKYRIFGSMGSIKNPVYSNVYTHITELLHDSDSKVNEEEYYKFCYKIKDQNIPMDEFVSLNIFLNTSENLYERLVQDCNIEHIKDIINKPNNQMAEKLIYFTKINLYSDIQENFDFRVKKIKGLIDYGIDLEKKDENNWNLLMVAGIRRDVASSLIVRRGVVLTKSQMDTVIKTHTSLNSEEYNIKDLISQKENMDLKNNFNQTRKSKTKMVL